MKNLLIPLLFIVFLFNYSWSQVNEITLNVDKSSELLSFLDLGPHGFAIKTGKPRSISKNTNWVIHRYTPNMEFLGKVNINKGEAEKGFRHHMTASPSGDYLYSIEPQGYNTVMGSGKYQITQFKNLVPGPTAKLDRIPNPRRLIHAFINDSHLCFLGTEKGNETYAKLKAKESLYLSKVNHDDLAYNYIKLDLPKLKDPANSTFWSYAGHDEEAFYVCSKHIVPEEGMYTYVVRKLDFNGNTKQDLELKIDIGNMHIMPSNNEKSNIGSLIFSENDYHYSSSGSSSVTKYYPSLGAFGNIQFDIENQLVYVYGLYSDKPYSRSKITYDGYFIAKYKMTGEVLWTKMYEFCDLLAEDKFFPKVPYNFFIGHHTSLSFLPNEELELKFWFKKLVCCHKLAKTGDILSTQETEFNTILYDDKHKLCSANSNRELALNYILSKKKSKFGNRKFEYYSYKSNAVVLEFNEFSRTINLKYFEGSQ